jgi:ATP-dependent Clp protease protease subunit
MKKYYSLERVDQAATVNIFGDISSYGYEGSVGVANLSKELEAMGDVDRIDVYLNSYGGEVAEGLAIYNALRRHKAKVVTHCEGFAASIASVIFLAGDERVMCDSSLLMIHNAWTYAAGDAQALRKQADDLEKITQASVEAYKAHSSLSEEEIKALMDAETWILPAEALEYGFATEVTTNDKVITGQSALQSLFAIVKAYQEAKAEEPEDDEDKTEEPDTPDEPEKEPEEPETPEPSDDEEDDKDDEEMPSENTTENEAAQKWGGFFNAILKI